MRAADLPTVHTAVSQSVRKLGHGKCAAKRGCPDGQFRVSGQVRGTTRVAVHSGLIIRGSWVRGPTRPTTTVMSQDIGMKRPGFHARLVTCVPDPGGRQVVIVACWRPWIGQARRARRPSGHGGPADAGREAGDAHDTSEKAKTAIQIVSHLFLTIIDNPGKNRTP